VNCERIRPLLSAYLDGELEPEEHARVDIHLAGCQACANILKEWGALGREIRALPDLPLPEGTRARLETRRRRRAFPALAMSRLASGLLSLAFVIALVALALGTSRAIQRMKALGQTAEVVATYPRDGATGVPPEANLTLTFARPMDRASVEAALQITPAMQLALAWQEKTLTIVPFSDWQPATAYTLALATTAREVEGGLLAGPFVLHFETVETQPAGALNPIGRFGYLWRAELGGPGGSLGYATGEEQELWSALQSFERGLMIWLDQLHGDEIYVLTYGRDERHGTWQRHADTWHEGDPASAGLTPPEGRLEPIRGFGQLWRQELGGPDAPVGWALAAEQGYVGAVQPFEHGLMLWDPLQGITYVLWDDSSWTAYPSN